MRKLFIVLGIVFLVIAIAFAILPMGNLGLLPVGLSLIFIILAFLKSDVVQKKLTKILFIIAWVTLVVIVIKSMIPDEVVTDKQFEKTKEASNKENLKDLEELENME